MKKQNIENYFCWSDSWVFTALYYSNRHNKNIDFKNLLAAGDVLNHAILTIEEIKNAFMKLQERGIIFISKDNFEFTDCGKELIQKIEKVKGGLFSRIDISLKKLNSSRNKFGFSKNINNCEFITDGLIDKSYNDYMKSIKIYNECRK